MNSLIYEHMCSKNVQHMTNQMLTHNMVKSMQIYASSSAFGI